VGTVGISLGVAEFSADESAEVWLGRADAALYRAKQAGRGRVAVDERGASDAWAAQSGMSAVRLVWQEAYECGEAAIDRQHRELFDLGNNLFAAAAAEPRSAGDVQHALDGLLAHIVTHFADEEAILGTQNYADLAAHKRAHARLLERAMALKAAVAAGHSGLGDLVEFLGNAVVAQHLFKADRAYFPLFDDPAHPAAEVMEGGAPSPHRFGDASRPVG
jgi:hemerythrin